MWFHLFLDNNIDYLKIFKLINNKDFDHKNIDKYINLLEKHNNIDGIIKYIYGTAEKVYKKNR